MRPLLAILLSIAAFQATLAASTPCSGVAGNLVANCGFESGDLTAWTASGNTTNPPGGFNGSEFGVDTGDANGGTYGLYAGPIGGVMNLSQSIAMAVNTAYTITFSLKQISSAVTNSNHTFSATIQNASRTSTLATLVSNPPTVGSFVQYTATFTPTGTQLGGSTGAVALVFSFRNDDNYWSLDDVSVTAPTVTVSGQVTVSGVGLGGVSINVSGSATTSITTGSAGNYSLNLTPGGTYTLSAALTGYSFSSPVTLPNLSANQTVNFTGIAAVGLEFYSVAPCRVVDTRVGSFPSGFGPPSLTGGSTRTFTIPANPACGIPVTAAAYSLNVTVVTKGYLGFLSIWPAGQPMPNVSTLNSYSTTSSVVADAAIVPAGTNGAINVYVTDATDFILDINGYFAAVTGSGLEFYPVTPCRLVDTRQSSFQSGFGAPSMTGGSTRSFAIPSNTSCGLPSAAAAYSLNVTAIPRGTLGILSIWPTGQPLPNVSTLNVYVPGTVVANAAIVPAGTGGAVNVYVTDTADVVVDIDGYFAPAASGGLKLYPVTPCRVADTRVSTMPSGLGPPSMSAQSQRSFPVVQSACGIPSGAGAYSLNFTAVPHAPQLGIFITWPTGQPQPNVSTMNSYNGSVASNAAIVPAGTGGAISIFVTDAADVLFDINGYFAF